MKAQNSGTRRKRLIQQSVAVSTQEHLKQRGGRHGTYRGNIDRHESREDYLWADRNVWAASTHHASSVLTSRYRSQYSCGDCRAIAAEHNSYFGSGKASSGSRDAYGRQGARRTVCTAESKRLSLYVSLWRLYSRVGLRGKESRNNRPDTLKS